MFKVAVFVEYEEGTLPKVNIESNSSKHDYLFYSCSQFDVHTLLLTARSCDFIVLTRPENLNDAMHILENNDHALLKAPRVVASIPFSIGINQGVASKVIDDESYSEFIGNVSTSPIIYFHSASLRTLYPDEENYSIWQFLTERGFKCKYFFVSPSDFQEGLIPNQDQLLFSERLKLSYFLRPRSGEILFDARGLHAHYNGTSTIILNFLRQLEVINRTSEWSATVLVSRNAYKFHDLSKVRLQFITNLPRTRRYEIAIVLNQIFSKEHLLDLHRVAWKITSLFYDTIAADINLDTNNVHDHVFQICGLLLDHIFFLSDYSRSIFEQKYEIYGKASVIYPSVSTDEYGSTEKVLSFEAKHLLVVGNELPHKNLQRTVNLLENAFPGVSVVTLRNKGASGNISNEEVSQIYTNAIAVIYPSTYEGFGFPILEALGNNKIVFALESELNLHLRDTLGLDLQIYIDELDLLRKIENLLENGKPLQQLSSQSHEHTWHAFTKSHYEALIALAKDEDYREFSMRNIFFNE
jgi:glycosyltransferase involved in cell wall biosynthesis